MANKPTKSRTMSVTNLISKTEVNSRLANNYDLPAIMEQIVQSRRITTSIQVEETDEGYLVLQGNRRTRGGQELVADPNKITEILERTAHTERDAEKKGKMLSELATLTKEILDNLSKVPVEVYAKGSLTEEERMTIIFDHGSQKPLCRTETALNIWRMDKSFYSEGDIIRQLYFCLAKFTGNERKLSEVPSDPKEREKMLRKWFHGTVGNYILAAHKMGPYVREQFILTMKDEDKLLGKEEVLEMRVSRDRVTQLSAARSEEKDLWTPDRYSPKFQALIEKFKAEDKGDVEKEKKQRLSVKDLNDKAGVFNCAGIRKAFLIAAGETGDRVAGLNEDDDRCYRDEQALKVLGEAWDRLPKEYQLFSTEVLHSTPARLSQFLEELIVKNAPKS